MSAVAGTERSRWAALYVLCAGFMMIVLDVTIVNVALPSIREDLGFSETSLAWVVNAYLLTYGGFLLLGGRLGDLFGHRRLFLAGITLFTASSLVCGLSTTQGMLIAARSVQGLGGAVASAVSLGLYCPNAGEPFAEMVGMTREPLQPMPGPNHHVKMSSRPRSHMSNGGIDCVASSRMSAVSRSMSYRSNAAT